MDIVLSATSLDISLTLPNVPPTLPPIALPIVPIIGATVVLIALPTFLTIVVMTVPDGDQIEIQI